jgi:hypothetical protein
MTRRPAFLIVKIARSSQGANAPLLTRAEATGEPTKRYGDIAVVDGVSLNVDHGLLVCLLGPPLRQEYEARSAVS